MANILSPDDIELLSDKLVEAVRWRTAAARENQPYDDGAAPPIPAGGEVLWGCFIELHAARTSSGFGANPIPFTEIDAYSRLMGAQLRQHEVAILRAMDDAWLTIANRPEGEKRKPVTFSTRDTKAVLGMFRGMLKK